MTPDATQLHGFTLQDAECFGKPHLGAKYTDKEGTSLTRYARFSNLCAVCGRDPLNTHHQPRREFFTLRANGREWRLRPALFAVCGTGTFGCHGKIEHNQIRVRWEWDSEENAEKWWSGELLEQFGPHSLELYRFGCWVFTLPDGTELHRRERVKVRK